MKIHQFFSSSIVDLRKRSPGAGGHAQISDCYVNICGIFATVTVSMYLKTKTLRNVQLLEKVKCLGDVLDSVSFPPFATLRSQLLDVFII